MARNPEQILATEIGLMVINQARLAAQFEKALDDKIAAENKLSDLEKKLSDLTKTPAGATDAPQA